MKHYGRVDIGVDIEDVLDDIDPKVLIEYLNDNGYQIKVDLDLKDFNSDSIKSLEDVLVDDYFKSSFSKINWDNVFNRINIKKDA